MKKSLLLCAGLALTLSGYAQTELKTDGKTQFTIPAEIYGQFAEHLGRCIYDGIWVGKDSKIPNTDGYRTDVFNALKDLQIPVLRWPGGCFADTYHWRDGVGPTAQRPRIKNVFWGGTMEDNSFGTDEFFTLCERLGCKTYLSVNVGSGTVKDMNDWLEYITGTEDCPNVNLRKQNGREKPYKIDYMGIGNESWGCGGNMRPEFYADLYRQYSGYALLYSNNTMPVRVASGSNDFDYNWTKVLMERCHWNMEHISLHYYVLPIRDWNNSKGPDRGFQEDQYFSVIRDGYKMDELVENHLKVIAEVNPKVKLDVDEWGIWTDQEPGSIPGHLYQQNTMRDALLASTTFDIFHKYADRLGMCNIAQVVNVLQAMILTKDDKMVLTPTYHVFKMYAVHQNAEYVPVEFNSPKYTYNNESINAISATMSKKNGVYHLSVSNVDAAKANTVTIDLGKLGAKEIAKAEILTSKSFGDYNSFDKPETVKTAPFSGASVKKGILTINLPKTSVVTLEIK
ncbi:MAG: alpha-N-arabinofuranosidase [Bacteroidales bacterium]|nr:alpha-N-arabinofuranosidase [Bacteroidales bacterium]